MDGFSGLINAQASSPNGYNAFSLMEKNQAPLPHESISMYEDNESSVMEGGNLNMWFSEFGGGMAMQLPEMEYYNLQTVEQSAGYVNNALQMFGDKRLQQQIQKQQYNNAIVRECSSTTPLASEISSFDESSFKVGRLSAEERKEKISRYMKKRSERNFSKKIKYVCRKTLADSRPRVRGRFAKNDEFGDVALATTRSQIYDYDDDEDDGYEIMVKEEDLFSSSDILANVSEVNSFKYNYTATL